MVPINVGAHENLIGLKHWQGVQCVEVRVRTLFRSC